VGRERVSNAVAYVEPARARPNLTVRGDAHVRRVVIEHGRAVGVELLDGEIIAAGEVVLSSGVVQDPLLLWRSGVGPAEGVRALGVEPLVDLPAVGANLSDHMVMTFSTPVPPEMVPDDSPSIQTILRATAPGSDRQHDLQLTPFARRHPDGRREIAISVSVQLPDGMGRITPTSADPTLAARIEWPFTGLPGNVSRLGQGWRLAAQVADASGISIDREGLDRALSIDDDELHELIAETHTAFYHGVGTCRMGVDPTDSVVDDRCAVHGVAALRVVDAAVVPTVPRANTNVLVTAVAERAVELIW
jgi:choline dehydrogenase